MTIDIPSAMLGWRMIAPGVIRLTVRSLHRAPLWLRINRQEVSPMR